MNSPSKRRIRELIDLGSEVTGHRVKGSNKTDIKHDLRKIIAQMRAKRLEMK